VPTFLTRRVTFDAGHRYGRWSDWSVDENTRRVHRDINVGVPEFTDGQLTPTCENLARFIAARVQQALGHAARVTEVRVAEDETISATHRPDRDAASRG